MSELWGPGDLIADRYEIRKIKQGGMGIVFLCYDRETSTAVAVKTFQDRFLRDIEAKRRFLSEAETWIALGEHPNIVQALRADRIHGRPYIFVECVVGDDARGNDLSEWLARGPLDLVTSLEFALQFCDGMIHAGRVFRDRQRPFVHRDIKPQNVLIAPKRVFKVTDFGLAHSIADSHSDGDKGLDDVRNSARFTRVGQICGTPPYMSPEQTRGENDLQPASDIYSFGCVLYETLCGHPPFVCDAPVQYFYCHREVAPDPVRSLAPNLPERLDEVVMRCLRKDWRDRYASFEEVGAELVALCRAHGARASQSPALASGSLASVRQLNARGFSLTNIGRHREAVGVFNAALALNDLTEEDRYMLFCNRGMAYERVPDPESALRDYTAAIDLLPNVAIAYVGRGNVLNNSGSFHQALTDFDRALALDPSDPNMAYNRGILRGRLGLWKEAFADYDAAVVGGLADALTNRGGAHLQLGRPRDALEDLSRALEINSVDVVARVSRASALASLGRDQEALQDLDTAIETNPGYKLAYFNRGNLRFKLGALGLAAKDFDRATAIESGDAERGDPLGSFALGGMEVEEIRARACFSSGVVYGRLGLNTLAIKRLEEFVALAGNRYPAEVQAAKGALEELRRMP